jgi:hypothetical protein
MRKGLLLVIVLAATVLAAAVLASGQAPQQQPPRLPPVENEPGRVISGSDLGFRIDDVKNGKIVGQFVVRVRGQWREIEETGSTKRLTD